MPLLGIELVARDHAQPTVPRWAGLLFLLISEVRADGPLPFSASKKTSLDHSWSVAAGMSGLFLLSHHLSLHHSVWGICTLFSCFIPEKPLHTTKLFTEKNLPYLPAQVAWSLLLAVLWTLEQDVVIWWQCHRDLLQPSLQVSVGRGPQAFSIIVSRHLGSSCSFLNILTPEIAE